MNRQVVASIVLVVVIVALLVLLYYRKTERQDMRLPQVSLSSQRVSPQLPRASVRAPVPATPKVVGPTVRKAPAPLVVFPLRPPDQPLSFRRNLSRAPSIPLTEVRIKPEPRTYTFPWVFTIPETKRPRTNLSSIYRKFPGAKSGEKNTGWQRINANGLLDDRPLYRNPPVMTPR